MITIPATLALERVDEPQVDGDNDAEHGNDGDGGVDDAGEADTDSRESLAVASAGWWSSACHYIKRKPRCYLSNARGSRTTAALCWGARRNDPRPRRASTAFCLPSSPHEAAAAAVCLAAMSASAMANPSAPMPAIMRSRELEDEDTSASASALVFPRTAHVGSRFRRAAS